MLEGSRPPLPTGELLQVPLTVPQVTSTEDAAQSKAWARGRCRSPSAGGGEVQPDRPPGEHAVDLVPRGLSWRGSRKRGQKARPAHPAAKGLRHVQQELRLHRGGGERRDPRRASLGPRAPASGPGTSSPVSAEKRSQHARVVELLPDWREGPRGRSSGGFSPSERGAHRCSSLCLHFVTTIKRSLPSPSSLRSLPRLTRRLPSGNPQPVSPMPPPKPGVPTWPVGAGASQGPGGAMGKPHVLGVSAHAAVTDTTGGL